MKYRPVIWLLVTGRMREGLKEIRPDAGALVRKAKPIYRDLLKKVEGVSDRNPMASNITMSFVILSIWLASGREITPGQMSRVMAGALDWKPLKVYFGTIDMNTEKGIRRFGNMMKRDAAWAAKHPGDWNTWDFHFDDRLHEDGFYYHFTHCPIAEFCRKYGYEEINPVLCDIDHITLGMMHSRLIREHTVAGGAGICDYWTVGDRVKDPK